MKIKLLLLLLTLGIMSCEKEELIEEPPFVDEIVIDDDSTGISNDTIPFPFNVGQYRIEYLILNMENLVTGQVTDSILTSGTYSMVDPIGSLEVLHIGERFEFTETQIYSGYYLSNLGDEWEFVFDYSLPQNSVTEEYDVIQIDDYYSVIKRFTIVGSEEDFLKLEYGFFESQEVYITIQIHLENIGPSGSSGTGAGF
jgi:hypothetical protein